MTGWYHLALSRKSVYAFAQNGPIDRAALELRLRKMSDAQLLRFGKDAKYMCSPQANFGKPPRETFVIQLNAARDEWKRRHPK